MMLTHHVVITLTLVGWWEMGEMVSVGNGGVQLGSLYSPNSRILEGEGNHSTSVRSQEYHIIYLLCTFTQDNNNNITRHIHL